MYELVLAVIWQGIYQCTCDFKRTSGLLIHYAREVHNERRRVSTIGVEMH